MHLHVLERLYTYSFLLVPTDISPLKSIVFASLLPPKLAIEMLPFIKVTVLAADSVQFVERV
jgi:hypothetical protein